VMFLSSTPGAPICSENGSAVTCWLGEIASGGNAQVTLLVQVASSALYGSQIISQADITSTVGDPLPGNNHASTSTEVLTKADLSIGMMDHPDPVAPGTNLTYTLVVTNNGPSDAISLILTDTLPSVVNYLSVSPNVCTPRPYTHTILDCVLPDLAAGQSFQIVLVVSVSPGIASPFVNHVSASSGTPDPEPGNNARDETTGIDDMPPTLQWVAPVGNEGIYTVMIFPGQRITLTVIATDNIGIDRVRFTRWDHVRLEWVDICVDREGSSGVYECEWVSDSPTELPNNSLNAIYAYAYDTAGNFTRRRIWFIVHYVLLPLIVK
jgi:uncharacterized repeat protein (TIGR01451 family)